MLAKKPGQRAFFMHRIDHLRLGTARSWGPFGDRRASRKAVSESPAALIEAVSGCR
jgi:hypothetical protein